MMPTHVNTYSKKIYEEKNVNTVQVEQWTDKVIHSEKSEKMSRYFKKRTYGNCEVYQCYMINQIKDSNNKMLWKIPAMVLLGR